MMHTFEELPWHDAVMLELKIDRRRPGEADEVVVSMCWPDGRHSVVRFVDCYALVATMNFGIVAEETVRTARECSDDEELRQHRAKWAKIGADLSGLKKFILETSSTASVVSILAMTWEEHET